MFLRIFCLFFFIFSPLCVSGGQVLPYWFCSRKISVIYRSKRASECTSLVITPRPSASARHASAHVCMATGDTATIPRVVNIDKIKRLRPHSSASMMRSDFMRRQLFNSLADVTGSWGCASLGQNRCTRSSGWARIAPAHPQS